MVEGQVRPNRVTDSLIVEAMETLPRELFVPKSLRGMAYVDEDLPIGNGRFLLQPMVLGRLLQEAQIEPGDVVLDVGCGSGYSTAVIARLANTVIGLESDPELVHKATGLLAQMGADNTVVLEGPLSEGHPPQGPYQVIVLNGAAAAIPDGLRRQLSDGGRLVGIEQVSAFMGKAVLISRFGDAFSERELFEAAVPYLPGFEPRPVFEF
jgi:protein-L-isoaspartate(D-aspartate) O-methyltransferase